MCGCHGSVPTQNSLPWKWGVGDGRLDLREADELTLCLLVPELILHSLLLLCKPVQVSCSWPPAAPEERKAVLLSTGEGIMAIRGLVAAHCCSTGGNAGFSQCPVDLTPAEMSVGVGQ